MPNLVAASCFGAVVLGTLAITAWAARKASGREDFYAANGGISAMQNALAIAGDFVSAATLLGTTAIYFTAGVDNILYLLPFLLGLCLMLAWIAGPLRELGRFTLGDVVTARLHSPVLRIYSGFSTIIISLLYLVGQLVGAGGLISILFGIPFLIAVIIVGALMAIYVTLGGMIAATWVQVIKAAILLVAIGILAILCLIKAGGISEIYTRAANVHAMGPGLFALGGLKMSLFSAVSLVVGLAFGTMGLPHLLIRAFTVRNAQESKKSVAIGTAIIALVLGAVFFVIAPATVAFVYGAPEFQDQTGGLLGGTNMAVVHLASAIGGQPLFGIIAAVAFATILAVVAGLTVSVASAAAHDIFATLTQQNFASEGHELWIFRLAAIAASVIAVVLAISLQHENVAVLIAGALVLAASANFPVLFLVIYWQGLTVAGAVAGGLTGLFAALTLMVLGPSVWVKVLGFSAPIFPSEYPTLITMPLAFVTCWLVSKFTKSASPQQI